ncbi:thiamine phosphate synthase [bacterium]|nr:thiamine phosphate synthase [bacterium]
MWDKLKEQFNLLKLEKKKLCLITNSEKFISKDEFLDAIASALQGGVDIVQLNEKNIPDGVIVEIGHKLRFLCDEYGATFIINGRLDIAQIVDADGVHLEHEGISIANAREILGKNAIIGQSTNTTKEVIRAFNSGADYITFGPIYTTPDKIELSVDVKDVRWINKNIDIPVFSTGEINLDNIHEIVNAGIKKLAITDAIMYAQVPEKTARKFLKYLL